MYLAHFNFKERPFALSTDPRFLWMGANQRQALVTLHYGLNENRGLVLLGGEFGAGKTTLINAFAKELDDDVAVARLAEPGPSRADFFREVARGFALKPDITQRNELVAALDHLAKDRQVQPQRWLLIIDEAQGLTAKVLEEVLELAQLTHRGRRRFHIILVGQNEVYQWIAGAAREAFIEQVSATCKIHPLSASETAAYIDHRLNVAGAGRTPFTQDAIQAIHTFSRGVPRTINLVCDFALLHAHLEDADQVDSRLISASKDRFQIVNLPEAHPPEEALATEAPMPAAAARTTRRARAWRSMRLAAVLLLFFVAGGGGFLAYHHGHLDPLIHQARIWTRDFKVSSPTTPSQADPPAAAAQSTPVQKPDPAMAPLPSLRSSQVEEPRAASLYPAPPPLPPAPSPEPTAVAPLTTTPPPKTAERPQRPMPDNDRLTKLPSPTVAAPPPVFTPPWPPPVAPKDDPAISARNDDIGPEASPTADPADIIDWLIREKDDGQTPAASPANQPPP